MKKVIFLCMIILIAIVSCDKDSESTGTTLELVIKKNGVVQSSAIVSIQKDYQSSKIESKTTDNNGIVSFDNLQNKLNVLNDSLTGNEIRYYVIVSVEFYKKEFYIKAGENREEINYFDNSNITYGEITDIDGNKYKTVSIGTQTWMAQNLRTTKYNDGSSIPNIKNAIEWSKLTTGAYCSFKNTANIDSIALYGHLYNWYSLNTGKLAPKGWHVPTDDEWNILITYLGNDGYEGDKLKETGTIHWNLPNDRATNETGFTALPGGSCGKFGDFDYIGDFGFYWTVSEFNSYDAWYWKLHCVSNTIMRSHDNGKRNGFSVRCIKDL